MNEGKKVMGVTEGCILGDKQVTEVVIMAGIYKSMAVLPPLELDICTELNPPWPGEEPLHTQFRSDRLETVLKDFHVFHAQLYALFQIKAISHLPQAASS